MALTLMPLRPNAPNILPLIPGWLTMLLPTRATTEKSRSLFMGYTTPSAISLWNAWLTAFTARYSSFSLMATHIECSEEPWVIRITFTPSPASAAKRRFEKPGMPTMPAPSRLSRAMLLMLDSPLIFSLPS